MPHSTGALVEDFVLERDRLVLVDAGADDRHRLFGAAGPALGQVVTVTAQGVGVVVKARAGHFLEQVEDHLALAEAVQEEGRSAAQRTAEVEAEGAQPEQVRGDALHLGEDAAQPARAARHLEADQLLEAGVERLLVGHRRDVVVLVDDGRRLHVRQPLAELLDRAVQITAVGDDLDDDLAVEKQVHAEDAVRRRVLRPEVQQHQFRVRVVPLDDEVRLALRRLMDPGQGVHLSAREQSRSALRAQAQRASARG
jgi:hypothetical protein